MPVIEIHPILTSTSDDEEGMRRGFAAIGLEAEPVGDTDETTIPAPAETAPPAEGQPPAEETAPASETGEEVQDEEEEEHEPEPAVEQQPGTQQPGTQQPGKNKRRRDRKIERLTGENLKLATDRARIEGENAELRRRLEAVERPKPAEAAAPKDQAPAPKPAETPAGPPARPAYPRLADHQFDQEAYQAAIEKYWGEEIPAYESAIRAWERQELERGLEQRLTRRDQETAAARAQETYQRETAGRYQDAKKRYPDFQQAIDNFKDDIPGILMYEVSKSELEWDIWHWVATNPEEAREMFPLMAVAKDAGEAEKEGARRLATKYVALLEAQIAADMGTKPPARRPNGAATAPPAAVPAPSSPPSPEGPQSRVSQAPPPPPRLRGTPVPAGTQKDPFKMSTPEFNAFMDSPEGKAWARSMNT